MRRSDALYRMAATEVVSLGEKAQEHACEFSSRARNFAHELA
jgi:hypothetical protein